MLANRPATTGTPPATTRAQRAPLCPALHPYATQEGIVDATMLAKAGLNRMNLGHEITAVLAWDTCLPAVAQGAIGIQIRDEDEKMARYIGALNHEATFTAVSCERAFLAALDGNCRTPIAGQAKVVDGKLVFEGLIAKVELTLEQP